MVMLARILLVLTVCAAAYLIGVYQGYTQTWPVPQLRGLAAASVKSYRIDKFGRLLSYPGKTEIPCPPQDKDTAVLLVFGQSNSANLQGQRYAGIDDHVVNFSEGRCYIASSPLLGADGRYGEPWTLLGNKLVRANLYRTVILIPAGVGGSSIRQWRAGGDLNRMVISVIRNVKSRYTITAMLWQQGATDYSLGMTQDEYRSGLRSLIDSIRAEGVRAPFFICTSSYQDSASWSEDNPISRAQHSLVDGVSIFAGPDTDHDVTALDRYDGLHFSASGQEKFTDRWVDLLREHRSAVAAPLP
ncbi:MAG: hypothetical protein JO157_00625 [Acetobacteraceae bacterium]|nr:hypothetical protein [Acetobacteraceae bacterium]